MLGPVQGNSRRVVVVEHDPAWAGAYEAEAERIAGALGDVLRGLHHIGSTSVPGLCAKPIIDILIEADAVEQIDLATPALERLSYEAKGEYGIPGRRYFRKDDDAGVRTHHIHAFAADSSEARRHLAFRDYLIAHPEEARRYGELKQRLAREHPNDIDAYMDGKAPLIQEQQAKALDWWRRRR